MSSPKENNQSDEISCMTEKMDLGDTTKAPASDGNDDFGEETLVDASDESTSFGSSARDDETSSGGTITPRGESSKTPPVSVHVLADRARARGEIWPSYHEKLAVAAATRQKARDEDPTGGFEEMIDSFEKEIAVDHKKVTANMTEPQRDAYIAENIAKGIAKRDRAIAAEKEKEKKIAGKMKRKDDEAKAIAEKEKVEVIKRWESGEDDRKDTTKVVVETKFDVGTGQEVTVVKKRRPTLVAADLSGKMKETYATKVRRNTINEPRCMPAIIEEDNEGKTKVDDGRKVARPILLYLIA